MPPAIEVPLQPMLCGGTQCRTAKTSQQIIPKSSVFLLEMALSAKHHSSSATQQMVFQRSTCRLHTITILVSEAYSIVSEQSRVLTNSLMKRIP